ncbi:MAG TPA: DUF47 family protein [Candidatus Dormibacteraeota bacterium]|nr:DUF47 family protein [Candidatus Dormibacteraeota bacterium]
MKLSLVPVERRFYELFEKLGALVSETLIELSKSLLEGRSRHPRLRDLEHRCDNVALDLYNLTNRTFTTPMEPEDILALTRSLDTVVDLAEEISDKIDLYRVTEMSDEAKAIGECLAKAGIELERAAGSLDKPRDLSPILQEIHRLENEGDRISRGALKRLFHENHRTSEDLIKWKDLYDMLEAAMDECETAAEIIETITIKNA